MNKTKLPKEPELNDFRPSCGCGPANLLQYIAALKNYIKLLKRWIK